MDIVVCIVCVVLLMVNNVIMSATTKNKEVKGWKYPASMYVFTITQIALVLIAYVSIIFYILRG
jgi:cellobiose-specific phosphotransferase system component IIB